MARAGQAFLQEVYEKEGSAVVCFWSPEGQKLTEVHKGEEIDIEVKLHHPPQEVCLGDPHCVCWSGGADGRWWYTSVPAETKFVRVMRASEGKLVTMRCYRSRPPSDPVIRSKTGLAMTKVFGTSGVFRMFAGVHQCSRCHGEIRKGATRWVCGSSDEQICYECGELEAFDQDRKHGSSQPGSVGAASPPSAAAPGDARADGTYHAGDSVQVWSVSQGVWLRATVIEVKDGVVKVGYQTPAGQANKLLPSNHEHLRPAKIFESKARPAAEEPSKATAGERHTASKSPEEQKADSLRRLERLLQHGDIHGARRTMARAQRQGVADKDLESMRKQLADLEAEGDLRLLLPMAAGGA